MGSRGDTLVQQAEKKASSSTGWFSSNSSKWEDAADLFQQAANAFKVDSRWAESGNAFQREAECRLKADEKNDAMNAYHNAAKSFKKSNPDAAINALHLTIKLVLDAGNFRQAADREKEIAQIYVQKGQNANSPEQHDNEVAQARASYVRAGDWYHQEDANATANQCYQQAAELSAELKDYIAAIDLYCRVADWSLTSPLTKYSVKEYWLRAVICAIGMGDAVRAQRLLDDFSRKDLTFASTREGKFAAQLVEAVEEGDVEQYTAAIFQYDQVSKLDNWKTKILLFVKQMLEEDEGGLL